MQTSKIKINEWHKCGYMDSLDDKSDIKKENESYWQKKKVMSQYIVQHKE